MLNLIHAVLRNAAYNLAMYPSRPHRQFVDPGESTAKLYSRLYRQYQSSHYGDVPFNHRLIVNYLEAAQQDYPHVPRKVLTAYRDIIAELMFQNELLFDFPDPPGNNAAHDAQIRERLLNLIPYLNSEEDIRDTFGSTILQVLLQLCDQLPKHIAADTMLTVPLYTFVDLRETVGMIVGSFLQFNDDHAKSLATLHTRNTIAHNVLRASKITPDQAEKSAHRIVGPMNSDLTGMKLVEAYLGDTPYIDLFQTPIPFEIPRHRFGAHGIIIAPPEHGKTQLLSSFIARFLADEEKTGIVILDPHGDLFASLLDKVPFERLIVLDPSTDPPPLNVFDFGNAHHVQILQAFTYLMAALTGGMTDKQAGILPYLLKLIRIIPDANITTLLDLVTERPKTPDASEFFNYVLKLPELDRKFFLTQFLGNKMSETKDAIAWKLSAALSYDAFRTMFTASHNSFDAFKAMEEQKVVLVKGSEKVLGEHGLSVFLQFIVSQFFLAALKRDEIPEKDRKLCILFADEASHVFNSQTSRILTECRKYRLGFLAATQVIQQIPNDVKAAIYGATAIKIAGPVAVVDAMLLAREMHAAPDDVRGCKSYQGSHAEWMFYVSNVTDRAIKVSVPFGAIDTLPTYTQPIIPPPPPPIAPPETVQATPSTAASEEQSPTPPPKRQRITPP